jgi:hypothetical protein
LVLPMEVLRETTAWHSDSVVWVVVDVCNIFNCGCTLLSFITCYCTVLYGHEEYKRNNGWINMIYMRKGMGPLPVGWMLLDRWAYRTICSTYSLSQLPGWLIWEQSSIHKSMLTVYMLQCSWIKDYGNTTTLCQRKINLYKINSALVP